MSAKDQQALDKMTAAIVNKLLHAPLSALKRQDEEGSALIAATRRLFDLDQRETRQEEEALPAGELVKAREPQ